MANLTACSIPTGVTILVFCFSSLDATRKRSAKVRLGRDRGKWWNTGKIYSTRTATAEASVDISTLLSTVSRSFDI
jgi:hypothetical protein